MRFLLRHPLLIVFLVGVGIASYLVVNKSMQPAAATGPTTRAVSATTLVKVEAATQKLMGDQVESIGTTSANQSVDITAKVAETLSKVHFQDGTAVHDGDLLAELTNAAEASRLAEAQASANDANRQLDRREQLYKDKMISANDLDLARTSKETADARLEGVMVAMKDRVVRAPFSGVLGFLKINPGSLVAPGTVITTLDDISIIKLDFTVPEIYLAELKPGLEIKAHSVVYKGREFVGKVSVIGSRVDPVTRSVQVRALIDNKDATLRPGMLMTIGMVLNEHLAVVVPEQAVVVNQSRQSVFVVGDDNKARSQQVVLGKRVPGFVEILSGLSLGDKVVTEGLTQVRPGQVVSILASNPS